MGRTSAKTIVTELLNTAGIQVNGPNPYDIQVNNDNFYTRILNEGALGLGESYMDHWWDCKKPDQFIERVLRANLEDKIKTNKLWLLKTILLKIFNLQTKKRAFQVGEKHYDLGNDLFKRMLDSRMVYTCGYWKNADNLEDAQVNKLELTCKKLMLEPGMRLLDIGCGWGSMAKYAAENFGVHVVGITISKEQAEYAKENCKGLPVEIRLQDYRDVNEKFDRIVSLGMFEHVGHLNYRTYMQVAHRCLTDDGIFLLHTIGDNISGVTTNEWIAKYIFPNGLLPSITQIGKASEKLLVMEDWHNFGADYDKTLMAWHENFIQHWNELKDNYNDRFYRMWNYYLLSCAGSFRARYTQLWQIVFSKHGLMGGYQAPKRYFQMEKVSSRDYA
ncbi:MAG: cyclopropane fatty acyl phospholipid synthase [Proteobacteria bacterium]|nr:cyclopropane fatty acyl phospholipid synthase [Pseudomonadota bacterium]